MIDKPILFSAPMVRALLDGRKTQTRRILKPLKKLTLGEAISNGEHDGNIVRLARHQVKEPTYNVDDRLWVREPWRIGAWDADGEVFALDYSDGPRREWVGPEDDGEQFEQLWEQTSDELHKKGVMPDEDGAYQWEPGASPLRWRQSIFMPRWASRLTLIVTDVKVERLQDIGVGDAVAEGSLVPPFPDQFANVNAVPMFRAIWCGINGTDSWDANPWVAAYSFRVIKGNIDQIGGEA